MYWKKRARAGLARAPPGLCPCFSLENRREDNTNLSARPPCSRSQLHAFLANSTVRSRLYSYFANSSLKAPNSSRFCSTPRVLVLAQLHAFILAQLHAFWPNSMCFGPRVSDLNSAHFDPTPHATATQASRPVTGGECASRTHRTRVLREPPHRGARRATKEQRRRAERRNNATGQQSKAQKNTRADCELRQRKAEYPRTPRAPRVSRVARRVRRTADGGGVASAEAGSGARERRARSGEKRTAKHRTNAGCALRERTAPGLPGRRARRVRPRACSWCGVRPAGARVERGSGACGVTDRTRGEEEKTTTARERPCSTAAARTTRMNARRARLARVNRRSARAAPSLRTERRVKRRRETRTTTGNRKREEEEEKTTTARDVRAQLRRREPPTPRGAFDRSTIRTERERAAPRGRSTSSRKF